MQHRKKSFVNNTLLLLLGKFISQSVSIILLPLYTRYFVAEDYGFVDLLQTYTMLFVPVATLRLDSAAFRYLIDHRRNTSQKRNVVSSAIAVLTLLCLTVLMTGIFVNLFIEIKYFPLFIANLITLMFSSTLLQMLRGLGKTKQYTITSIIIGIVTLVSNLVLIIMLNFKAEAILMSSIIANLIGSIVCVPIINFRKHFNLKSVSKKHIHELLKYSLPMVPNSLSWWIVDASDRSIISIFLGSAMNGIYTISCKLSNILNSIYNVINLAWQETIALHIDDPDRDTFLSEMINDIFSVFFSISLFLLGMLPIFYDFIIGNEFLESYVFIPILLYANCWNIMSNLIGGIFLAKKRTKILASTTIYSAILNIIINLALINICGLYAACFSTLISYLYLAIHRYHVSKKYVDLDLRPLKILAFSVVFIISSTMYYLNIPALNYLNLPFVAISVIAFNHHLIKQSLHRLTNKLLKRSHQ